VLRLQKQVQPDIGAGPFFQNDQERLARFQAGHGLGVGSLRAHRRREYRLGRDGVFVGLPVDFIQNQGSSYMPAVQFLAQILK
jgi:hypothetical protein